MKVPRMKNRVWMDYFPKFVFLNETEQERMDHVAEFDRKLYFDWLDKPEMVPSWTDLDLIPTRLNQDRPEDDLGPLFDFNKINFHYVR